LRVAQLDGVAGPRGQLLAEAIELIGPLERIGEILAAHRLKLEHERPGVIAERALVGAEHGVLEDVRVQEVAIPLPGQRAPPHPGTGDDRRPPPTRRRSTSRFRSARSAAAAAPARPTRAAARAASPRRATAGTDPSGSSYTFAHGCDRCDVTICKSDTYDIRLEPCSWL